MVQKRWLWAAIPRIGAEEGALIFVGLLVGSGHKQKVCGKRSTNLSVVGYKLRKQANFAKSKK